MKKDKAIIGISIAGLLFWLAFLVRPAPVRKAMRNAETFLKRVTPKPAKSKRPPARKSAKPRKPEATEDDNPLPGVE